MAHASGKQSSVRAFAKAEEGGAAVEMALLLGLAAFFAFSLRHVLVEPVLAIFNRATQVISQALAG
ncbi:hypothetical protein [uncultured Caulobacter sp.]|uniref:hypothetical protein n=1 Tax=uncultured Caulobacter sp. TaxID=158749 RepID=UPI00263151D9|nr:hypothetical protein [uncultured Caulobacter sp.]